MKALGTDRPQTGHVAYLSCKQTEQYNNRWRSCNICTVGWMCTFYTLLKDIAGALHTWRLITLHALQEGAGLHQQQGCNTRTC
jgi:hypothetical protein